MSVGSSKKRPAAKSYSFDEMKSVLEEYLEYDLDVPFRVEEEGGGGPPSVTFRIERAGDAFTITAPNGLQPGSISHNNGRFERVDDLIQIGPYVKAHLSAAARALIDIGDSNRGWRGDEGHMRNLYGEIAESTGTEPAYVERIHTLPQWWTNDQGVGENPSDVFAHDYQAQQRQRLMERVEEEKTRREAALLRAAAGRRSNPLFYYWH